MSENSPALDESLSENSPLNRFLQWVLVALLVYLLIAAVGMIGSGFKAATKGHAVELFEFATNPFMALVIGIVATSMIQSSSTVTSIIVGLVAGGLPVDTAIPMIMGANIGTTVTNSIVSLAHVKHGKAFRRAFAAATVHDFFNLLAVAIFLPLEIMFGFLEKLSDNIAHFMIGGENLSVKGLNFIKPAIKPLINLFQEIAAFISQPGAAAILVVFGIFLIFLSITLISRVLKKLMVGRARKMLHTAIGKGPVTGIFSGTVITVLVQSSSTTTSLMVPLAGSGIFRLKQIYPFTLGANIGTTITALLAATAVSGPTAVLAMEIAIVHLLYNMFGVVLIYGFEPLREIPLKGAMTLARLAEKSKIYALSYLLGLFFVLPGILVVVYQSM